MARDWHTIQLDEIFSILKSGHQGLSGQEAQARLMQFGHNKIESQGDHSLLKMFFRQFFNPLVIILIIAAMVKFFVSNPLDGAVLSGTILIMVFIGFIQEAKAENAMQALKKLSAHKSKVKRNGTIKLVLSESLVPGDIIILETGDKISADARLIEITNFKVSEATLTGESMPVDKHEGTLSGSYSMMDRRNMVYTGSTVACGKATAIVVETAMNTELGKIASTLGSIKPE
jgi:Ca2+-transporting ATPase